MFMVNNKSKSSYHFPKPKSTCFGTTAAHCQPYCSDSSAGHTPSSIRRSTSACRGRRAGTEVSNSTVLEIEISVCQPMRCWCLIWAIARQIFWRLYSACSEPEASQNLPTQPTSLDVSSQFSCISGMNSWINGHHTLWCSRFTLPLFPHLSFRCYEGHAAACREGQGRSRCLRMFRWN